MKNFIKNHTVAFCGVLSLLATLLPFMSLDCWGETVTASVFEIMSEYDSFSVLLLFVIPVILIVINFILKNKAKKIACIVLSVINLLSLGVVYYMVSSDFELLFIASSPSIGLFIILACDIALIVLSIFFAGKNFETLSPAGKKAKEVSNIVAKEVISAGSEAVDFAKERAELAGLKSEVNVIDKEIDASYLMTGKKLIDYIAKTGEMPGVDVSDVLKMIDPKVERKEELTQKMIKLEKRIMDEKLLREKQAAEKEFEEEKSKLDKALMMEVLDKDDYDARVAVLQKKLDNFDAIRKLEQQVEMGLITKEEKDAKLYELLN